MTGYAVSMRRSRNMRTTQMQAVQKLQLLKLAGCVKNAIV